MSGELIKREHRLTKFLDILNPEIEEKPTLGKKEEELWQVIQKAYSWRTLFHSPDKVRRMIMDERDGRGQKRSYSSACQIYQDMEYIYGKTAEINKEAQRRIIIEYCHTRIEKIEESDFLDQVDKEKLIEKWVEKIIKLSDLSEGKLPKPEELMPPPQITFITGNQNVQVANLEKGGKSG